MASPEPDASPNDTSAAVASDEVEPFRLLDLPPEIWSKIGKTAIEAEPDTHLFKRRHIGKNYQPSITRTCRILRQELLPFFWKTKFNIDFYYWETAASQLGKVLKTVGKDARHAMRGLWVLESISCGANINTEQQLKLLKGWDFKFELDGPTRRSGRLRLGLGEVAYNVKFP